MERKIYIETTEDNRIDRMVRKDAVTYINNGTQFSLIH